MFKFWRHPEPPPSNVILAIVWRWYSEKINNIDRSGHTITVFCKTDDESLWKIQHRAHMFRPASKTVESAKMEEQIRLIGLTPQQVITMMILRKIMIVVRIFPSKIERLRFSLDRLPIYYDFFLVLFPINKSFLT